MVERRLEAVDLALERSAVWGNQRRWREEDQFWTGLFVLNADGTETRLSVGHFIKGLVSHVIGGPTPDEAGGSFSPTDPRSSTKTTLSGPPPTAVITYSLRASTSSKRRAARRSSSRQVRNQTRWTRRRSPRTGNRFAYLDGLGDMGTSIWVMNADGSDARGLVVVKGLWPAGLVWSPDGSRLAFSAGPRGLVWVVGADGSGLTSAISHGVNPHWSPDGSRIAYERTAGGSSRSSARTGRTSRRSATGAPDRGTPCLSRCAVTASQPLPRAGPPRSSTRSWLWSRGRLRSCMARTAQDRRKMIGAIRRCRFVDGTDT